MPVARGEDEIEVRCEALDGLGDLVAPGNLERPSRGEVVLEVDDEKRLRHVLSSNRCYSSRGAFPMPAAGRTGTEWTTQAAATAPPRRGSPPPRSSPLRGSRATVCTPPKNRLRS